MTGGWISLMAGMLGALAPTPVLAGAKQVPETWYLAAVGPSLVEIRRWPPQISTAAAADLRQIQQQFREALRRFRAESPTTPIGDFLVTPSGRALCEDQRRSITRIYQEAGLSPARFDLDLRNRTFVRR